MQERSSLIDGAVLCAHCESTCYDLVWVRAWGTPPGVVNSHTDRPDGYLLVPFGLQTH